MKLGTPPSLYADSGRVVSDAGGREKSNAQKAEAVHLSPSKLWGKAVSELVRSPSRNGTEAEWREWEAEALGVGADVTVWKERMLAMYRSGSEGAALTKEGDTTPEGKMWKYHSSGVKAAKSFTEKLNAANAAGNSFPYIKEDGEAKDTWQSPREFLQKEGGDCEDIALYKYALLLEAGVPKENMKLALVEGVGADHALLLVTEPETNTVYMLNNNGLSVEYSYSNYYVWGTVQEDVICWRGKRRIPVVDDVVDFFR